MEVPYAWQCLVVFVLFISAAYTDLFLTARKRLCVLDIEREKMEKLEQHCSLCAKDNLPDVGICPIHDPEAAMQELDELIDLYAEYCAEARSWERSAERYDHEGKYGEFRPAMPPYDTPENAVLRCRNKAEMRRDDAEETKRQIKLLFHLNRP